MFRVKDAKKSLDFYTRILGMELLDESSGSDFTNYFLAFPLEGVKQTMQEKKDGKLAREGVLELCHNWGTENDADFSYHNGNTAGVGRGFGHICYTVDSLQAEVDRITALGEVKFIKRPEDGKMRYIAFIADPDSYWIEIVGNTPH